VSAIGFGAEGVKFKLGDGGFYVPGWLIATVGIVAAVLYMGFDVGRRVERIMVQLEWFDYRTCRIEARLNLDRWPSCVAHVPGSSLAIPPDTLVLPRP
jgi:hypothetical protein